MTWSPLQTERSRSFALSLATAVVGRTVLNTARRFPYTYSVVLARGLGVDLETMALLLAGSQAVSLASPVVGPLVDRWGYRPAMICSLLLLLALLLAGLLPTPPTLLLALVLASLGKVVFDPAVQAWIGERVPFARRGRAIGAGEVAWSASTLLGVPLVGVLIGSFGWRAPLLALGALGPAVAVVVAWGVPGEGGEPRTRQRPGFREAWRLLLREPVARGALLFGFLISLANDCLFVVYGAWLEREFGLGVTALGAATIAIGVAELGGEGLTALGADRVGLRRAVMAGTLLCVAAYACLPWGGGSLVGALAGLFSVFLVFEFTMVASFGLFNGVIPLNGVIPRARATMLSAYFASLGLGRLVGVLTGSVLWSAGGMLPVAAACAVLHLVAAGCLAWTYRRWRPG